MASNGGLDFDPPVARIEKTTLLVSWKARFGYRWYADQEHQATVWTLVALALILVVARLFINVYAFRQLHVADGFAVLSFACLLANGVSLIFSSQINPTTRHSTDMVSPPVPRQS